MADIIAETSIQEAIQSGFHYLLNSEDIFQCVRCNAFCLSDTIENIPIVSDITKEIICYDCFSNLLSYL